MSRPDPVTSVACRTILAAVYRVRPVQDAVVALARPLERRFAHLAAASDAVDFANPTYLLTNIRCSIYLFNFANKKFRECSKVYRAFTRIIRHCCDCMILLRSRCPSAATELRICWPAR